MSRNDEVVLNAPFVYSGLRFPENQMGFREQHDFGEVMILYVILKCLGSSCFEYSVLSLFSSAVVSPCDL